MNYPKNLLIVRTDRIGDVVLSLPLAGIIKKYYPECKITFLLREYTQQLANNHPHIDDVILLKEKEDKVFLWENVKQIKKRNFDACIVVYPTFITALIVYLSGIKIRIGTGYRWYSSLFSNKVFVHRKFAGKHELEFNVDLLKEIGISEKVEKDQVSFELKVNKESKQKVESLFKENKILKEKPVIIIHPGSGGSAVDLPVDKFKELVKIIATRLDVNIILTGSKKEIGLTESIAAPGNVYNFAGKLDLSGLIALIDESDIFLANSTGPIHIAAALNKYVIGFYPNKLACSARRWGPYTNKSLVFTPKSDCEDCSREQCERDGCMNTIKVTDVFEQVEKFCKILANNGEING